jgi:predicted acylesterase/phospholipase RssA
MSNPQAPARSGFAQRYFHVLEQVRNFLSIVFLIRFSVFVSLLASIALLLPEQGLEALRVMAEDRGRTVAPLIWFAVAALLLSLMSWYWARVLLYIFKPLLLAREAEVRRASRVERWGAWHLPRLCGALPLLFIALALWNASNPVGATDPAARSALRLLALLFILAAILLYIFFIIRGRRVRRDYFIAVDAPIGFRNLGWQSWLVLLASLVLSVTLFLIFTLSTGQTARWLGTSAIVLLALASWTPIGSTLVYWSRLVRLPLLAVLLILAVAFSALDINDNHRVRYSPGVRAGLPPEFGAAFDEWLANRADLREYPEGAYPVFIISAEGGGLRAAYFTGIVLAAIQDRCPAFAQHVFAISGVSGGSIGATIFAGLASREAKNLPAQRCELTNGLAGDAWLQRTDGILKRDFLSPLLATGLYPDLAQRFLPFPVERFDRARALEIGFEEAWTETTGGHEFSNGFYELWRDFPREATPALFLNTTRVETGERMVVTNLYPLDERFNRLTTLADVSWTMNVPLSTAATLSARFPLVTPAGYFPIGADARGRPVDKQRYVDGGYFENSGTATLYDILAALRVGEETGTSRPKFQPVIIRIGNFLQPLKNDLMAQAFDRSKYKRQGLGEILSPINTLLNTREARGGTAVRQLETVITAFQDRGQLAFMFGLELKEEDVSLPLGWLLSGKARRDMVRQLGTPRVCEEISGVQNDCEIGNVIDTLVSNRLPAEPER